MGIWSVLTLSQTKTGDALILADVTIRVRYFFVLTFCLNVMCACEYDVHLFSLSQALM